VFAGHADNTIGMVVTVYIVGQSDRQQDKRLFLAVADQPFSRARKVLECSTTTVCTDVMIGSEQQATTMFETR
jgi:hypothetical protein